MVNKELYESISDFLNKLYQKGFTEQEIEHTLNYILEEKQTEKEMVV